MCLRFCSIYNRTNMNLGRCWNMLDVECTTITHVAGFLKWIGVVTYDHFLDILFGFLYVLVIHYEREPSYAYRSNFICKFGSDASYVPPVIPRYRRPIARFPSFSFLLESKLLKAPRLLSRVSSSCAQNL
jgi:hypothetical protein